MEWWEPETIIPQHILPAYPGGSFPLALQLFSPSKMTGKWGGTGTGGFPVLLKMDMHVKRDLTLPWTLV